MKKIFMLYPVWLLPLLPRLFPRADLWSFERNIGDGICKAADRLAYAEAMGPSLELSELTEADTDFIAQLAADERVMAYIGDGQPWSYDYAAQRVAQALKSTDLCWCIARSQGTRIGLFTATDRKHSTEIGYWIAPEFWGQGWAKALVGQGLARLQAAGRTALIARVALGNAASLKVLIGAGFIAQSKEAAGLLTLTCVLPPNSAAYLSGEVPDSEGRNGSGLSSFKV